MRPRMLRKEPEPDYDEDPPEEDPEQSAKELKSREGLQETLNMLERLEAFAPVTGDAIMCKQCGMPCYDDERTALRRAFPAAGAGVICGDCFLGGV